MPDSAGERTAGGHLRIAVALAGPLVCLLTCLLPTPADLPPEAWRLTGVAAWMVIWWLGQAAPLPATSLLPVVLMPPLGIAPLATVTAQYADPLIFLFLGGFLLAAAMQRHGLHRRLALWIVAAVGTTPQRIVLAFMLATAFLSMWISNTATAVMMFAVGTSVIEVMGARADDPAVTRRFGVALMLAIAYAASIGGLGTLIGTPGNALLASVLASSHGIEIGFGQWMLIGLPLVAVMLPIAYLLLTRVLFPARGLAFEGLAGAIAAERAALGPMTRAERTVAVVFGLAAAGWMLRAPLGLPFSDPAIGLAAALLLFLLPVEGGRVVDWGATRGLSWGVLILLGGGLALATGFEATGLADWIGAALGGLAAWPLWAIVLTVVAVTVMLTEVTSNTAVTATFLPILAAVAIGLEVGIPLLTVPVALASSMAFMMPVATPPNAIVLAYEGLRLPDMVRAGVWLNLIAIATITVAVLLLVPVVLVP